MSQSGLKYPERKISDTLLQFAKPLLDGLGPHATEAHMEQPLRVAWTVWNAVVCADVSADNQPLSTFCGQRWGSIRNSRPLLST